VCVFSRMKTGPDQRMSKPEVSRWVHGYGLLLVGCLLLIVCCLVVVGCLSCSPVRGRGLSRGSPFIYLCRIALWDINKFVPLLMISSSSFSSSSSSSLPCLQVQKQSKAEHLCRDASRQLLQVRLSICIYIYIHLYIYKYTHTFKYKYMYIYILIYKYECIYIYTFKYKYMYIYMNIYIYIYIHI